MNRIVFVFLYLGVACLVSCIKQSDNVAPQSAPVKTGDPLTVRAAGQRVYVPTYSSVYSRERSKLVHLTVTLSIRNISEKQSIQIPSIRYFDSAGKLLKQFVQKPLILDPLATHDIVIEEKDLGGGTGANFLVDWESENHVSAPIIEAVMISTAGQQGISFVSRGRALNEQ